MSKIKIKTDNYRIWNGYRLHVVDYFYIKNNSKKLNRMFALYEDVSEGEAIKELLIMRDKLITIDDEILTTKIVLKELELKKEHIWNGIEK